MAECQDAIANGANVNAGDPDARGATALHMASRNGHIAVVRLLLDENAQVQCTDRNGEAP